MRSSQTFTLGLLLLLAPLSGRAMRDYSELGNKVTEPECIKEGNDVETSDQLFARYKIDKNSACPTQSKYDDKGNNCHESALDLQEAADDLQGVVKYSCQVGRKMQLMADQKAKGQDTDMKAYSALTKDAKQAHTDERKIIKDLREKLDNVMKYQSTILDGVNSVKAKTQNSPKDAAIPELAGLNRALGTSYRNAGEAINAIQEDQGTITGLSDKAFNGRLTGSDVQNLSPLVREPATIAAAAHDLDQQMAKREQLLKQRGDVFGNKSTEVADNAKKLGAYSEEKKTADAGSGASSGQQASAAGGAGGGGAGSGSGSGVGGETGGGNTPTYAAASPYSSGSGSSSPTATAENSGTVGNLPTFKSASLSSGVDPYKAKSTSGTNSIENLDQALVKTASAPTDGSAASRSPAPRGSALRDALAARYTGAGGGGVTAVSAGGASGGTGSSASSGSVPEALLPQQANIASDQPLEAASGSTGGDLGATDFSLAGSETDSAIKGMLGEMGLNEAAEHGARGLASTEESAPEILAADTSSLFLRTRETHQRSLKKGLVINGLKAKL